MQFGWTATITDCSSIASIAAFCSSSISLAVVLRQPWFLPSLQYLEVVQQKFIVCPHQCDSRPTRPSNYVAALHHPYRRYLTNGPHRNVEKVVFPQFVWIDAGADHHFLIVLRRVSVCHSAQSDFSFFFSRQNCEINFINLSYNRIWAKPWEVETHWLCQLRRT